MEAIASIFLTLNFQNILNKLFSLLLKKLYVIMKKVKREGKYKMKNFEREIKKGIKIAIEIINLEGDLFFVNSDKETKAILRKIDRLETKAEQASHLIKKGYEVTMNNKSIHKLNLSYKGIEETIYTRNESDYLCSIDSHLL